MSAFKKSLFVLTAISFLASTAAFAADPAVNQVDQRVTNQEKRVDDGVQKGTITAKQQVKDDKKLTKVQEKASKDEAKDGGKLTKAQQRRLNRSLDKNSATIKDQKAQ